MSALTVDHVDPERYGEIRYALITKDGRMFDAGRYGGHGRLAYKLEKAGILPESHYDGCVHISDSDFDFAREDKDYCRVTQQQFNTMFDYMMAKHGEFPWDRLEVI